MLTVNHYDRPGLAAWWGAAAVVGAIARRRPVGARDVHFAIAREWWYPSGFGRLIKQPFTRWFFGQVAKSYELIPLPPVLDNVSFRGEGTVAIRHAVAWTRATPPQVIGLAPEGRTGDGLCLCKPPAGAGLLLLLLTHGRLPVLPAGIYEDSHQRLSVRFGEPYSLSIPIKLDREERDSTASRLVMVEIGKTLPERMWGAYAEEIRAAI